jgi:hypothetical protein
VLRDKHYDNKVYIVTVKCYVISYYTYYKTIHLYTDLTFVDDDMEMEGVTKEEEKVVGLVVCCRW